MSKIQKRVFRIIFFGSIALIAAASYVLYTAPENLGSRHDTSSSGVAGVQINGRFDLINHEGQPVSEEKYAGFFKLIYFGFTYCPSICPTELQKITAAYKKLGSLQSSVVPIFISVDPERDTVPVMKEYVAHFHPDMIGLTGSVEQIEEVKKNFKVFAAKVTSEQTTDYTVDHSSFIYLVGPENKLLKIFRTQDTAKDIAGQTREIIKAQS